jgi:hypothetical protein
LPTDTHPELFVLAQRRIVTRPPQAKHLSGPIAWRVRVAFLCTLLYWAAACASAGSSHQSPNNESLITLDEIENSHQPTLYDVVRALRPNWLRNAPSAVRSDVDAGISVYLDTQRAGSIDVLRQMPSSSATSLRFYTASEAQSQFGLGNLHGVIQVVSSRGSR